MGDVTLRDLLEAGVHFGHQTRRWNPKMKPYIFASKNKIHVIDLQKTLEALQASLEKVSSVAGAGGKVLFLGTKPQAKVAIREQAERCGMPYVTERWLGGTLTNFDTVRKSLSKIDYFEKIEADGTISQFSKKEALDLSRGNEKLLKTLGGIRTMKAVPQLLFVVDIIKEINAVREARRLAIPIIGLIDTNADPNEVDFPIPANDDAMRAIGLFSRVIADAVIEGRARFMEGQDAAAVDPDAESRDAAA